MARMTITQLSAIAERFLALEKQINSQARSSQLAFSSVEDGAIGMNDVNGVDRGQLGQQYDGTYTTTSRNGPVPPTPNIPSAIGGPANLQVGWDGNFVDAVTGAVDLTIAAPEDWLRTEVHIVTTDSHDETFLPDLGPESTTRFSTIESAGGATTTISLEPGDYWVKLVAVTQSGVYSSPSAAEPGTVLPAATSDVVDALADSVTTMQSDVSDVVTQASTTEGTLSDYMTQTDTTLGTLQSSFDVLNGLGNAGVEEDYFFVGDDPTMQTIKLVQISPFIQGALGAPDGPSFVDAVGVANAIDVGDAAYDNTDSPMTVFYNAFASAGLSVRPWM